MQRTSLPNQSVVDTTPPPKSWLISSDNQLGPFLGIKNGSEYPLPLKGWSFKK